MENQEISQRVFLLHRPVGRHLSNIYDHRRKDAEMFMCHDYNDMMAGPEAMHRAWLRHLEWINTNVIGPPKATAVYSQKQLEEMGMIGIYARES